MKFKFHKRKGNFGKGNFRNENHGKEKVPAVDFKIKCTGGKRELNMLMPLLNDSKITDFYYDEKGNLLVPFLSPLRVHRKPDNVNFRCWDSPTNARSVLEFDGCVVKDIEVVLKNKWNCDISFMVQIHDDPEKHSARLRRLMDQEREFELESAQEDFPLSDPENDDEAKKKAAQPELPLDEEGEEAEGEDDDEDDDE